MTKDIRSVDDVLNNQVATEGQLLSLVEKTHPQYTWRLVDTQQGKRLISIGLQGEKKAAHREGIRGSVGHERRFLTSEEVDPTYQALKNEFPGRVVLTNKTLRADLIVAALNKSESMASVQKRSAPPRLASPSLSWREGLSASREIERSRSPINRTGSPLERSMSPRL